MKLSDRKITEDDVKDILLNSGFAHVRDNVFWSIDFETNITVALNGNTLTHLICWIYKFYAKEEREWGKIYGENNIKIGIKTLLGI
jgi:hypothetical protein